MMGKQDRSQNKLFYTTINLEKRIRKDHVLRRIASFVNFDFIYSEVKDHYGQNGNVSVPPPIILKMMLLLILYNVRSERELIDTIPERLDWLWFLGYDLDDEIPNHSVLSKARTRWGVSVFKRLFETIVSQCVQAGLVGGQKIFMDASLVKAHASNNSVVNQHSLKRYLNKSYRRLEASLESQDNGEKDAIVPKSGKANRKYVSTTDPDAAVIRMGSGRSKLRYKIHRAVDEKTEVITATEVTTGEVNEAHLLTPLVEQHENNTGRSVKTTVADSKYGTIENYLACKDLKIEPHFDPFDSGQRNAGTRKGIFEPARFVYNPEEDFFICPAGKLLEPRKFKKKRNHIEYAAKAKTCNACRLKPQCTRSKTGRSVKRHIRQDELDQMLAKSKTMRAKQDIKKRQHLMERSFARGTRYGIKTCRWRRLWRAQIQEHLAATVQNIMVLISSPKGPSRVGAVKARITGPIRQFLYNIRLNLWLYQTMFSPMPNIAPIN
jgi:transposase/uncharacterized protein (UPF0179 family)